MIEKINPSPGEYEKDFMKTKFNSDDNLPLSAICLDECLYKLWMLEYDRIDISEEIDINKTNALKECNACH